MKLHTISFGCQMNVADSEEMGRTFEKKGFGYASAIEEADAILINTCTVRQHAEDRAFSFIGSLKEWKKAQPDRLLIVTGCAAERTKATLQKRFPFVDLVVGAKSIEEFPQIVNQLLTEKYDWEKENKGVWPEHEIASVASLPRNDNLERPVTAFITTMRGCNYTCSYCIVPFVRGREIYRDPAVIASEVKERVAASAQEITLLGQTVNSFRWDSWNFAKLIQSVGAIEGVQRIRFMSPHPHYMTDELIETMATTKAVCQHIHLPLQSGSDRILALMHRNYTCQKYKQVIQKLRSAVNGIAITTDIITGFPTETEEDFQQSLKLIEEIGFDGAYCFKYSPREGTRSATMEGQIPESVKEDRLATLLKLTEKLAAERAKNYAEKTIEVLFEEPLLGRSRTNHWVELETPSPSENLRGSTGMVSITAVKNRKLYGRLVIPCRITIKNKENIPEFR